MKNNNIWAPWRIEYLKSLSDAESAKTEGKGQISQNKRPCFLCQYKNSPENDRENLVLWRASHTLVIMNRFPYTTGHLLVAPHAHVPDMDMLDDRTMLQMMQMSRDAQKVIAQAIHPHGFNIGINIGRCAGAGLPNHIHLHVVPRWDGDTNFMSVNAQTRVISQSLEELYDQLEGIAKNMDLPKTSL